MWFWKIWSKSPLDLVGGINFSYNIFSNLHAINNKTHYSKNKALGQHQNVFQQHKGHLLIPQSHVKDNILSKYSQKRQNTHNGLLFIRKKSCSELEFKIIDNLKHV